MIGITTNFTTEIGPSKALELFPPKRHGLAGTNACDLTSVACMQVFAASKAECCDTGDLKIAAAESGANAIAKHVKALESLSIFLFVSQASWVEDTVMNRRREFGRANWQTDGMDFLRHAVGAVVQHGNSIRLVGIAPVSPRDLVYAIRVCQGNESAFVLLTKMPHWDEFSVKSLYRECFGDQDNVHVDWPSLLKNRCSRGDVISRAVGGFDDQEVQIDVFGPVESFEFQ